MPDASPTPRRSPPGGRATCRRCHRPEALCWCPHVRPFETEARFCILMHPLERKVGIGTGRMSHHALIGSSLLVGRTPEDDPRLVRLLDDESLSPAVLYPCPDALDLSTACPADARAVFPSGRRPLIILLDGTWTTAGQLLRASPRLAALPRIRFTPSGPARYDLIRREPRPECRSTLEAIHCVIDALDALGLAAAPPGRAHDSLLDLLDATVEAQAAFEPAAHRRAPLRS